MRGADCNTRQFVVESVEQRFGYLGRLGGSDNVDREAFDRKYTRRLNPQQTEAVHAVDGAVLLLAVPAAGKTTVLVTRLGYMLCCCGIAPDQILTMTYTRAATREMKQRFSRLFGMTARRFRSSAPSTASPPRSSPSIPRTTERARLSP